MEDPAEIAVLTSEYISTLDNLPLEVIHILREIELKDAKTQDVLSRISSKEAQMKDFFSAATGSSSGKFSDGSKAKFDKLAARIASDYARAEDWSSQKQKLSYELWENVLSHYKSLVQNINQIHPDLVAEVQSSLPKLPVMPAIGSLPMALADSGFGESDSDFSDAKMRRRRALHSLSHPSHDYGRSSPSVCTSRAHDASHPSLHPMDSDTRSGKDTALHAFGNGDDERDENLYCFCQRGSFGEMIGCDSDDCKYEWFHIGCVGVSKPLPQTWLCSDCLSKNKKRRRA